MWIAIAIVALALLAEAWSRRLPDPLASNAAPERFSAGRAIAIVERLLGDGAPHPVGSAANARVRERIVDELRAIGLEPELQSAYVCRDARVCAPVVNVLARIRGSAEGPAIMLASHYDSVHAGPGAGDDTHGVAVMLEVARALVRDADVERDVVLLFDEGEEVGLLGAEAFVRWHPWAKEVDVAINVEARGTTGRAAMFETSAHNGELVARYADAVPSPEATSLSVEVYRRMPNDTDFTVLRKAGIDGINFAFIGGVARYHTPLDDLAHLDPGSVQHQGDSVLAVTRAYAHGPLPRHATDAAYTDLFGITMVRWPARWSVPILVVALVVLVGAAVASRRRGRVRALGLVLGALGFVVVGLGAAMGGAAIVELVSTIQGMPLARPLPLRIAMWLAIGTMTMALAAIIGRRVRAEELAIATWLVWGVLGLAITIAAPGAAPLFVLPLVPAALAIGVCTRLDRSIDPGALVGLFAFAVTWAALPFGLEDAFAWVGMSAAVPAAAAFTSPTVWAFAGPGLRRALRIALASFGVGTIVATAIALRTEPYDADHRPALGVLHATNLDEHTDMLFVSPADAPLPAAMQSVAEFRPEPAMPLTWMRRPGWIADVPATAGNPATLTARESTASPHGRRVRAHLDAPAADRVVLTIEPRAALVGMSVATETLELPRSTDPYTLVLFGIDDHGVDLVIDWNAEDPIPVRVTSCGPQLPAQAAALAAARDETAVTFQWGDAACTTHTARL